MDDRLGFPCNICPRTFLTQRALNTHIVAKHSVAPGVYDHRNAKERFLAGDTICYWCGEATVLSGGATDPMYPTIEHLIPKSQYGTNKKENLVIAHKRCNQLRDVANAAAFKRLMNGEAVTKFELWPNLFAKET